jgi:hypothetical protein
MNTTNPVRMLSQKDLAAHWRMSARTLEAWRCQGTGPVYTKIGRRVLYRIEDIEAYEAAHVHQNTSGAMDALVAG